MAWIHVHDFDSYTTIFKYHMIDSVPRPEKTTHNTIWNFEKKFDNHV